MRWLERAYAQKDPNLNYMKSDLRLKSFAADPRYKAFLRKMKLPEQRERRGLGTGSRWFRAGRLAGQLLS
jgi:hypothetical protein